MSITTIVIEDVDKGETIVFPIQTTPVLYKILRGGAYPREIVYLEYSVPFSTYWLVSSAWHREITWYEDVRFMRTFA